MDFWKPAVALKNCEMKTVVKELRILLITLWERHSLWWLTGAQGKSCRVPPGLPWRTIEVNHSNGGNKYVLLLDYFLLGKHAASPTAQFGGCKANQHLLPQGQPQALSDFGPFYRLSAPALCTCMWGEGSGTKPLWFPWKNIYTNLDAMWNLYKAAPQWHPPAGSHYSLVIWPLILEKDGCLQLPWVHIQWETQVHTTTNLNLQLMLRSLNNFSPRHGAKENTTKTVLS